MRRESRCITREVPGKFIISDRFLFILDEQMYAVYILFIMFSSLKVDENNRVNRFASGGNSAGSEGF